LGYIDLNPVRAGIVKKPEQYRWSSLGYHAQTKNKADFLSLDSGLVEFGVKQKNERLRLYRRYAYNKGSLDGAKSKRKAEGFEIGKFDRFRARTRYFTESGIIGTKAFVSNVHQQFKDYFSTKHEKRPKPLQGLDGIYSLKRLSERI
jgi:hypothetical protein